ncbi:GNAT family N-acetyltransferase [Marinomonas spartinae]|uniref:GNAT family N-acetyltransferase n=1 Tax=Marinomonas spartinae TaxID=1792290 RepID=UPI001F36EBC8|nr:GNAT family N-acetyltransferase [Marinomonas spartinae]
MTGNQNVHHTLPVGKCVSFEAGHYHVTLPSGGVSVHEELHGQGVLVHCELPESELLNAFTLLFEQVPQLRCIDLSSIDLSDVDLRNLSSDHLAHILYRNESGQNILWREAIMQRPHRWLLQDRPLFPHKPVLTKAGYHPMRPAPQQGELYRRYLPELQQHISLLGLNLDEHLALFNKWQNNDRVAAFWDQKGSLSEHRAYLAEQIANHKNQLLIACLDDEPFAYIEAYWTKEDRIAPYYAAGDYDRGIHMLVGEEHHRGAHKVAAWLPSVCHYLYLVDPRTDKIVSEPRADNQKMIRYLQAYGFAKLKEFDFPHKRSALMCQLRENFFVDCF